MKRRALVTGGGRGIGAAVARRLAAEDMKVVVTGRTESEIAAVAEEIGGVALVADLGDRESTDAMLERLREEVGRIDVLVNNAGLGDSGPFPMVTDEMWDRVMEVNVTAPLRLCRALLQPMIGADWGRVINIASNAGLTGYKFASPYCTSKHALVGLTRALATELGHTGVTINAVCPGWVRTRMSEDVIATIAHKSGCTLEEAEEKLAQANLQRRMLEPEEVAHTVAMLCSKQARGIHGQTIVVDGGHVMK